MSMEVLGGRVALGGGGRADFGGGGMERFGGGGGKGMVGGGGMVLLEGNAVIFFTLWLGTAATTPSVSSRLEMLGGGGRGLEAKGAGVGGGDLRGFVLSL